ncbi:unnamed protein product [Urochloa humidicola]
MVDSSGRNVFHGSVVGGKVNVLRCLLRHVRPAELVNRGNNHGDTPLHLAVAMSRVQSALLLLQDRRVDPCVLNRDAHTARSLFETRSGEMDPYKMYLWKELKRQESIRCRKQQLPPVNPPRTKDPSLELEDIKHTVQIHVLIATVITTVTFAASFTMPGGYSQTEGTAIHGQRAAFKIFVISNTFAMCSSIVILLCFLWPSSPNSIKMYQILCTSRLTFCTCVSMLVLQEPQILRSYMKNMEFTLNSKFFSEVSKSEVLRARRVW